jgi:predicted acetyltransferase
MEIRAISDEEVPALRAVLLATFGGDPGADPLGDERFRALVPAGGAFVAIDRGQMVGAAATYVFDMTVPGGALPISGLTMVAVRPTHRRRGALRALMAAHLDDTRRRGHAISGLWASEATIYRRFGYGIAAEGDDLSFQSDGLGIAAGYDLDEMLVLEEPAPEILPRLYDTARLSRPGMMSRSAAWWRYRRFADRPDQARGASPRRHAVSRRGETATGYITYRHRLGMDQGLAAGGMEIEELVATDARAEATLWRYTGVIDLFPKVSYWNAPIDATLPWLCDNPRRVRRRRYDTLWLHLLDVPAALAARRYGADGRLVLDVVDPPSPEARTYELTISDGAAACAPASAAADLRLDRAALGSLYLGHVPASLLARAGLARGEGPALALADRMFASPAAPWCTEIF